MYNFTSNMKIECHMDVVKTRLNAIKYKTHNAFLKVVDVLKDTIKRRRLALEVIYTLESWKRNHPKPIWSKEKAKRNTDNSEIILKTAIRQYKCYIA